MQRTQIPPQAPKQNYFKKKIFSLNRLRKYKIFV